MIEVETAIIGGGQAGVPLARALADAGRSVAVFEREHLGGSCVNFGCTPSKAVIACARLAADARRASEYGLRIPQVAVDFPAVMQRARRIVADAKSSLDGDLLNRKNPTVITAHARLAGRKDQRFRIQTAAEVVIAERVVLDTGTRSARPQLDGLESISVIDAENWLNLTAMPARLLILGGSYIALEMAQAFRRLGSQVTVLQQGGQIAEREDPDIAEALQAALEADGVAVRLGIEATRVEAVSGGVRLHLADGIVEGTHLFLATGRKPNTDDLGLQSVGVALDEHGMVQVDERLRSKVPGIWAVGDIRGGPAFTHAAYDDFKTVQSQFLGDGSHKRRSLVPYALFTDPELGRIGMTETQARKAGCKFVVGRHDMKDSGKARELGKLAGFVKVLIDIESDRILGAAALCVEGAEVVQLFVELINSDATAQTMLDAVHIHPTLCEAAKNAVAAASIERKP